MEKEIIEKYLPIIQKHYLQVKIEEIKLFTDGHDHYVLLINNTKAFRFPRSAQNGDKDPIDNILLQEIAQLSPVRIPVFQPHEEGNIRYQTYDFISGVGLSQEISSMFSINEKKEIATLLGKFLYVVHSFPIERARALHMDEIVSPEDYAAFFRDLLDKDKVKIFPLLGVSEQAWIEKIFAKYIDVVMKNSFTVKVTHFDMLPEHIIVDPKTRTLSGVIDFSFRIGDPARDFMSFDRYGREFLEAAYKSYGKADQDFETRRQFYALDFPLANLYTSLEENNEKLITIHLAELKEYIQYQSNFSI